MKFGDTIPKFGAIEDCESSNCYSTVCRWALHVPPPLLHMKNILEFTNIMDTANMGTAIKRAIRCSHFKMM